MRAVPTERMVGVINRMHKARYQIIKLFGITGQELGRLHEALEGDVSKPRSGVLKYCDDEHVGEKGGDYEWRPLPPLAKVLRSRLADDGMYVVEIKVWMKWENLDLCGPGRASDGSEYEDLKKEGLSFLPSIQILRAIYGALGFYPDEERVELSQ